MKKILIAVVAVAVVIGAYFLVMKDTSSKGDLKLTQLSVSDVETILEKKKSEYAAGGFNLTKVGDHYTLVAADEQKARQFLIQEMKSILPASYDPVMQGFNESLTNVKEEILKGMVFDMDIVEDSEGAKVEVTLKMLPESLSLALQNNKEADTLITNFLAKGGFAYKIAMNAKGEVEGVELKDINEDLTVDNDKVKLKLLGVWVKMIGDMNGKMESASGLSEVSVNVQSTNDKSMTISLNDLTSTAQQTGPYDQTSKGTIAKMSFDFKEFGNLVSIALNNTALDFVASSKNGFLDGGYKLNTKTITGKGNDASGANSTSLNMNNFVLDVMVNHIQIKALEAMQTMQNQGFQAGLLGTPVSQNAGVDQAQAIVGMLQSGLSFHINALNSDLLEIQMPNGMPPIALHDFKFNVHVDLKENTLDMSNPMMYMPFVEIKGSIAMAEADLESIGQMAPMAGMFLAMKRVEGGQAIFDIEFAQGHIKVNGNQIQ